METIATNVERELKRVNSRPADLPEFRAPPLSEFVVGVQFAPIPGYSSIDARAIWELFRSEFPIVQEQTPLPPQFETFGGGQSSGFQIQFGTVAGPMRLWFVGEQNNHLLQFQPDRFLLNWRRSDQGSYPRYEVIADRFQELLCALKITSVPLSRMNLI